MVDASDASPPAFGKAGGGAAATPRSSKSTKSIEPRRLITGFCPGARVKTTRTSGTSTSGCWNAWISETGPPVFGKIRSDASCEIRAFGIRTTSVVASGSLVS